MKRYVLCGLSNRGMHHFAKPLLGLIEGGNDFREYGELTAVLDIDRGRVEAFNALHKTTLRYYSETAFERMIEEEQPDVVLIAGPDDTHFPYMVAALDSGCDVIVEKPMVITMEQAKKVMEAERRSGRRVTVCFNARYRPLHCAIKRLLQERTLGSVVQVDFNCLVDSGHGSSYFLRWNREVARSGGLNMHKSCHHFDLLNWWLDDTPAIAFAIGRTAFYGPESPHRPLSGRGETLPLAEERRLCPYFQKHYAKSQLPETPRIRVVEDRGVLLQETTQYPEEKPIYLYDAAIDAEDVYSALFSYRKGAIVNYSINFSAPWEGYRLSINLTHGRIEVLSVKRGNPPGMDKDQQVDRIHVLPLFDKPYDVEVKRRSGSHGGSDHLLQIDLFQSIAKESKELKLMAGSIEGAYAVAASDAVGISMRNGIPVTVPHIFLPQYELV